MLFSTYHNARKKSIYAWPCVVLVSACLLALSPANQAQARVPDDNEYHIQSTFFSQINAPLAWDLSVGSKNVVVAIIDVGVNIKHPDLKANIWVNNDEIPNNGIDDDKNGYIDDINGWNFVDNNNNPTIPDIDKARDSGVVNHGTISAGIIGAVGNNGLGVSGINWNVSIMALRAIKNNGGGSFNDVIEAVEYAADNGADIINMSLVGTLDDKALNQSILNAKKKGVLVVAAAGNERANEEGNLNAYPKYPICSSNPFVVEAVIGVTSVDRKDRLSQFANYGSCVDISAPGENINSTLYYFPELSNYAEAYGGNVAGTSFAAPFVAGAAALIKSVSPGLSVDSLKKILFESADNIEDENPAFEGQIGYGRLNLSAALEYARSDESHYADSISPLYYFTGKEVRSYDSWSNEEDMIMRFYNLDIKDLQAVDLDSDNDIEVVMLIKRDPYYYIRILEPDGSLLKEFPVVDRFDNLGQVDYNGLAVSKGSDGLARFTVDQIESNEVKLIQFDWNGEKVKELKIVDVEKWHVGSDNRILVARLERKKAVLRIIDWDNSTAGRLELKNVDEIFDLKSGVIWGGDREEQVMLARVGNKIEYFVTDILTTSWYENILGDAEKKNNWAMIIGPHGRAMLPYNLNGGRYIITDGKGRFLRYIDLPLKNTRFMSLKIL
ncbi:MAG: S8 family peptidase [bacterium]